MVVPNHGGGVLFCLLYVWTGSLYAPLAAHALVDAVSFGPALGWTWQQPLALAAVVVATVGVARLVGRSLAGGRDEPVPQGRWASHHSSSRR
jgi:hypothetical protein